MSLIDFDLMEQGMRVAQQRAVVLATDAAESGMPGFIPRDLSAVIEESGAGLRFAAALRQAPASAGGAMEYAMGATAENSIRFRALADQERAMLHEFRAVAEDARR